MTPEEKKKFDEFQKKKLDEMDILFKEFPDIKPVVIGAMFIMNRFNIEETRKALKK